MISNVPRVILLFAICCLLSIGERITGPETLTRQRCSNVHTLITIGLCTFPPQCVHSTFSCGIRHEALGDQPEKKTSKLISRSCFGALTCVWRQNRNFDEKCGPMWPHSSVFTQPSNPKYRLYCPLTLGKATWCL